MRIVSILRPVSSSSAVTTQRYFSARLSRQQRTFVREVQLSRPLAQDRLGCLDTHQAPGAAANIDTVLVKSWNGGHCARSIICAHGDHWHGVAQAKCITEIGQHIAKYRARCNNLR